MLVFKKIEEYKKKHNCIYCRCIFIILLIPNPFLRLSRKLTIEHNVLNSCWLKYKERKFKLKNKFFFQFDQTLMDLIATRTIDYDNTIHRIVWSNSGPLDWMELANRILLVIKYYQWCELSLTQQVYMILQEVIAVGLRYQHGTCCIRSNNFRYSGRNALG